MYKLLCAKTFPYREKRAKIPFVKVINKVVDFIKESYEELKKTRWPSREQTMKLTLSLIVISAGMGLFVSTFDYIFEKALALLINR